MPVEERNEYGDYDDRHDGDRCGRSAAAAAHYNVLIVVHRRSFLGEWTDFIPIGQNEKSIRGPLGSGCGAFLRNKRAAMRVEAFVKSIRMLVKAKTAIIRTIPLMRDARVPGALKASAAVLAVLVISPLDLFSDVPVLGVLDDAALLTLLCMAFVAIAERMVMKRVASAKSDAADISIIS